MSKRSKQQELRSARYFKLQRTPLSGSASGHTQGDAYDPSGNSRIYLEQKDRKRHALWSLYEETQKKAKAEGKIPILTLTEPHRRGFLIVLCSDDFDYLDLRHQRPGQAWREALHLGLTFRFKREE